MASTGDDFVIDQDWKQYTPEMHDVWRLLFERQMAILPGRVVPTFVDGVEALDLAGGIPDFDDLSDVLERATGWRLVAVPGLVPDDVFFEHLAKRRFPATRWIRRREQLDYLEEPDLFHDVFGHVPLLMQQDYADYMEDYGRAGRKALAAGALHRLARLYWYTVEFGLIRSGDALSIFGAGIASSQTESIFSLEDDSPNRVAFDLERVMRTRYRIDDFQETYFVIDNFRQLTTAIDRDLDLLYRRLSWREDLEPGRVLASDCILNRGSGAYHATRRTAAA